MYVPDHMKTFDQKKLQYSHYLPDFVIFFFTSLEVSQNLTYFHASLFFNLKFEDYVTTLYTVDKFIETVGT